LKKEMRIAICGGGLVGSYLYRLLKLAGYQDPAVFDLPPSHQTRCGINPCAWGVLTGFSEMLECAGLHPAGYIVRTFDNMVLNGTRVKARIMIIDKPKLHSDMLKGAAVKYAPPRIADFDRLIDATGSARACLPPPGQDLFASCVQYRVTAQENLDPAIDISNLGYAWRFPLSACEYHIGAGSVAMSPRQMLEKLGWLKDSCQVCACASKIRLSGPHSSQPFVYQAPDCRTPVWGVGEAIGCVSPLMGEGILPGLVSAKILLDNWDDPEAYREAILKEFAWMKDERQLVNKMVQGKKIGIFDAATFSTSAKRLKMNLDYSQALGLLSTVNRTL
jgi:flavin-dependent dehydrogenase